MFKKNKKNESKKIDDIYDEVLDFLKTESPDDDKYDELLQRAERLAKLRDGTKKPFWSRVSPDAIVAATASLVGIGLIAAIESRHVISSKQFNFVPKTKA